MAFIPPQELVAQLDYWVGVVQANAKDPSKYSQAMSGLGVVVQRLSAQLLLDREPGRRQELLPFAVNLLTYLIGKREFAHVANLDAVATMVWNAGTTLRYNEAEDMWSAGGSFANTAYYAVLYACQQRQQQKPLPAPAHTTEQDAVPRIFLASDENGEFVHPKFKTSA